MIVVDYGVGNLGSILRMLRKLGVSASLSKGPEDIPLANKLILPGVGAFDNAMKSLREKKYIDVLNHKVLIEKTPVLGICLGMQLFGNKSGEGCEKGLGWLDAETVRFQFDSPACQLKVPHMGWNTVQICQNSPLFPKSKEERRFYFIHSYYMKCHNTSNILTTTNHGIEFTSAVCYGNIFGVQFHPEKSHKFGMQLLKNFAEEC